MTLNKELTARQKQVMALFASGITHREIATQLGVSRHTVRRHIEQIYKRVQLPRNDKYSLRKAHEGEQVNGV